MERLTKPLLLAAACLALLPVGASSAFAQSKELLLFNWSNYMPPDLLKRFAAETGIKVTLDTYDSNETMLAKLQAGGAGYDVVVPTGPTVQVMVRDGLLMKFDASIVEGAIDAHAKVFPQVNIPRLLEQIQDASPRRSAHLDRSRLEKQRVEEENRKIEATLSRLSGDELRACANQAIQAADPATRSFLQNSDPMRSAVLRSLIYQRLTAASKSAGIS